jgi:multidrug efflux pump subunit AcrA (membrane-fusion protein)
VRRLLHRRVFIASALVVVLAGAGVFLWVRHDPAGLQYRTAAANLGTVTQTVALSGNLSPVGPTNLDFNTAGKVLSVDVQVGQNVTTGTVLAAQDTASLQNSLTQAQATLTSAQAKLSMDKQGASAQNLAAAQAQVSTAQVQLVNDETSMTDTEAVNQQSMQQAQHALQTATNTKNTDCGANPSSTQCAQDQQTVQQDTDALQSTSVKAQQNYDQAQAQVRSAQVSLQNAQAALAALETGTSSQQIQMDQSQIDIDQVNVNNAQSALNAATLTAPAGGVVAEVNITAGQQVSGASSSAATGSSSTSHAIVIITPGAFEVTGSVSDALVNQITLGQQATVVPAGAAEAVTGHVTSVAVEATVTSGVATFPVTVVLDGANPALRSGMSASVNVIVNRAVGVLTVPTSAVQTTANGSTVQVLVNGQPQLRAVQVGASDSLRTEIVSGLSAGDEVVIATVSSTIPSSGNNNGGGLFGNGRGGRGNGTVQGPPIGAG